jgi:hypothetical protein
MPAKQGIGGHQQCPRALLNERCKRHVKVSNATGLQKEQLLPRWGAAAFRSLDGLRRLDCRV